MVLANQIDALLRQALVLNNQLVERSDKIDVSLLYQSETDKPILEKTIYEKALKANLISQLDHDKLMDLYFIRNRAVHRYIISDLQTNDIINLVGSYTIKYENFSKKVNELEMRQFKEQIGIHKGESPPDSKPDEEWVNTLISNIRDKHGNKRFNDDITIRKQYE